MVVHVTRRRSSPCNGMLLGAPCDVETLVRLPHTRGVSTQQCPPDFLEDSSVCSWPNGTRRRQCARLRTLCINPLRIREEGRARAWARELNAGDRALPGRLRVCLRGCCVWRPIQRSTTQLSQLPVAWPLATTHNTRALMRLLPANPATTHNTRA